ncbi:ABC transporter ATP-binding protein [Miniphocaeibacter massiliensis]|uniref:ABC transporter ATP-binding protein n=1 Tax=Miniphocaeibacter massiliensis TaxID=2041841 RepID=UPI001F5D55C4|nr:ABC transporter ATP-binding protein [Miniphocaeibacter massiliensis]
MKKIIEVKDLYKVYKMGEEKIYALKNINLEIHKNEIVTLLGASGSGKSTLLNILAGLEKPTKGKVNIGGITISSLNEKNITKFRQLNIGFIFQSYNLISSLTALENVELSLMLKGVNKKVRKDKSMKILYDVGLGKRLNHKPTEMSGGQQQRVSIARALVDNPKIVFADEPTGNLDSKTSREILEIITGLVQTHEQTLILVTHDNNIAKFGNKVITLNDGSVENIKNSRELI